MVDKKTKQQSARRMAGSPTPAESVMWNYLRMQWKGGRPVNLAKWVLGWKQQQLVGPYIADFYNKRLGWVIEVDGNSHDQRKEYDKRRDSRLRRMGILTARVPNRMVLRDPIGALEFVREQLTR